MRKPCETWAQQRESTSPKAVAKFQGRVNDEPGELDSPLLLKAKIPLLLAGHGIGAIPDLMGSLWAGTVRTSAVNMMIEA